MCEVNLNKQQAVAVNHFKGPMLVLSGPGSGKTTVITYRVKMLIEKYNVKPSEILVITFTKAAAVQMEERFNLLCPSFSKKVLFGTFHSVFFRILRHRYGYKLDNIIKEDEKWNIIKAIIKELNLDSIDEEELSKDFFNEYSFMKNEIKSINEYIPKNMDKNDFKLIAVKYEFFKDANKKIDFDDMLFECYQLFKNEENICHLWKEKYKFILVDEFQDVNKIQYECLKILASPRDNIFAVGDDDQSIYSFRGSEPKFLFDFPKDFSNSKIILLETNYRSTESIIKLSNRIIKQNKNRYKKEIKGTGRQGNLTEFFLTYDTKEEAQKISYKILKFYKEKNIPFENMAVIFRTNTQGSIFASTFLENLIPFILKDNTINVYNHWICNDIKAYMKLCIDDTRNTEFLRILNKPKRYISKESVNNMKNREGSLLRNMIIYGGLSKWQEKSLSDLRDNIAIIKNKKPYEAIKFIRKIIGYDEYMINYAEYKKMEPYIFLEIADEIMESSKETQTFLEFFEKVDILSKKMNKTKNQNVNQTGVSLSTMHSAKGLEYDVVFIPGVSEGIIPHEKCISDDEIEEERRLFYVGVTRAKTYLHISSASIRHDRNINISPFLKELGLKPKNIPKRR